MARFYIYRNLHKNCWSIRWRGRVIAHAGTILAERVDFKVNAKGRDKVRLEGRKNVHAFVVTDSLKAANLVYTEYGAKADIDPGIERITHRELGDLLRDPKYCYCGVIVYNPYKYDTFVTEHAHAPVTWARTVLLDPDANVARYLRG